jgi:hypothetical protein
MTGAMCARAEAQVVRLSVLYALLDRTDEIADVHLRAALTLWSYCEQSIKQLFGDRIGDPTADAIMTRIQTAGGRLDRWELFNALNRHVPAAEIDRAVDLLSKLNKIKVEKIPTRGRSKTILTVCAESEESEERV